MQHLFSILENFHEVQGIDRLLSLPLTNDNVDHHPSGTGREHRHPHAVFPLAILQFPAVADAQGRRIGEPERIGRWPVRMKFSAKVFPPALQQQRTSLVRPSLGEDQGQRDTSALPDVLHDER